MPFPFLDPSFFLDSDGLFLDPLVLLIGKITTLCFLLIQTDRMMKEAAEGRRPSGGDGAVAHGMQRRWCREKERARMNAGGGRRHGTFGDRCCPRFVIEG